MSRLVAVFFLMIGFSVASRAQTAPAPATSAPAPVTAPPPATTAPAPAAGLTDKNATYLICKNHAVVRTLRVSKKPNGGCMATYTKDGVDQVVGQSWTSERCSKVIGNIRENLEKANWKCKDISEARVSSSEG